MMLAVAPFDITATALNWTLDKAPPGRVVVREQVTSILSRLRTQSILSELTVGGTVESSLQGDARRYLI